MMTKILFLLLFLTPFITCAQKLPDMGMNKVRITETGQTIVAELDEHAATPVARAALFYSWYSAGTIHATQGGYSGVLLNGLYTAYYANKNLKEQGTFSNGLKNGTWKSWKEDGSLDSTVTWKKGKVAVKTPAKKFWRKLPFFRKKTKPVPAAKPGNP